MLESMVFSEIVQEHSGPNRSTDKKEETSSLFHLGSSGGKPKKGKSELYRRTVHTSATSWATSQGRWSTRSTSRRREDDCPNCSFSGGQPGDPLYRVPFFQGALCH